MKDGCDFLGMSVEIHRVFVMPVPTREFKIENLQKEGSNMAKKIILIIYFVPGYCNLDRSFSSRKTSIAKQDA
jgi:hypothetical protein